VRIRTRNGQGVELLDGAIAANGRVWGCYVHGLFDNADFRRRFLHEVRTAFGLPTSTTVAPATESPYDRLAVGFEQHLDLELLWKILDRRA
jgi:adenosylcobyric acid synthase